MICSLYIFRCWACDGSVEGVSQRRGARRTRLVASVSRIRVDMNGRTTAARLTQSSLLQSCGLCTLDQSKTAFSDM